MTRKVTFEIGLYSDFLQGFMALTDRIRAMKLTIYFEEDGVRVSEIGKNDAQTEFFETPRELKKYLDGIEDGYFAKENDKLTIFKAD